MYATRGAENGSDVDFDIAGGQKLQTRSKLDLRTGTRRSRPTPLFEL